MKKLLSFFVVLSVIVLIVATSSCKKDEDINVIITVKYLSDTAEVVPLAHVLIEKYDVSVPGVCNEKGVFEHTFRDEMILDVRAWEIDSLGEETMYGETTIRLVKGKTVRKSVFIN